MWAEDEVFKVAMTNTKTVRALQCTKWREKKANENEKSRTMLIFLLKFSIWEAKRATTDTLNTAVWSPQIMTNRYSRQGKNDEENQRELQLQPRDKHDCSCVHVDTGVQTPPSQTQSKAWL